MPPETTYERYKRTLGEIAAGAKRPADLAKAALDPPRAAPTYIWKRAQEARAALTKTRRDERTARAKATYQSWMDAGRPPIATYAKSHGLKRSTMQRLLRHAEKDIPRGQRRLDWWRRSRDYRTVDEIDNANEA